RLRAVFESYSHDFPFSDGEDVAVVSVRDDIVRPTGAACSVPVRNLLAYSSDLHRRFDPTYVRPEIESIPIPGTDESEAIPLTFEERFGPPVWARLGCTADPTTQIVGGCVDAEPLDQGLPAVFEGSEAAYRVVFGRPGIPLPGETEPHGSWTSAARIAQTLTLAPGRYRVSWYGRSPSIAGMFSIGASGAVVVTDELGNPAGTQSPTHSIPDSDGWARYFRFVELTNETVVEVAIPTATPTPLDPNGQPMSPMVVDLGGLMVEEVSAQVPPVTSLPGPSMEAFPFPPRTLVATRAAGYAELPFCEDPTGANFRSRWRRGCERLCPAGPGTCASGGRVACYWELPISIGLEDLETGLGKLRRARFAYGNYNYRWSHVGVNIVGTGLRDCAGVGSPSTCYGGGFAPFSLHHASGDMGFPVRNHRGDAYLAPVFEGRVEHARALVAERYLTNPLSSADRSLVEPYLRTELRGRPLAGTYTLRIWEDEAFDWSQLEDVQLVMGYRYWTRLR
ncbi:MAG: hypothetical protein KF729_39225, partial [Sandaracinaceae bacterium]|nr:hypothetical protein [Sandaracinaceae bacterium]